MTMASIGTYIPIMDTPQYTTRHHGTHRGIGISVPVGDYHSVGDIHPGIGDGIQHAGILITTIGEATTTHTDITLQVEAGITLSTEATAMQSTPIVAETDVEVTYLVPPVHHAHHQVSEQAQLHVAIEIQPRRDAQSVRRQVPTECTIVPAAHVQEPHAMV